jgi:hypothetical protein
VRGHAAVALAVVATLAARAAVADEAAVIDGHRLAAAQAFEDHEVERLAYECELAWRDWHGGSHSVDGVDPMRAILGWCARGLRSVGRVGEALEYHLRRIALEQRTTDPEVIEPRAEPWAVAVLVERRMAEGRFVDAERLLSAALALNPSLAEYRIERRRGSSPWSRAYPIVEMAHALAVEHGLPRAYRAIVDRQRR